MILSGMIVFRLFGRSLDKSDLIFRYRPETEGGTAEIIVNQNYYLVFLCFAYLCYLCVSYVYKTDVL